MFVKVKEDSGKTSVVLEIGEIQEGDLNDIEKELRLELTELSAIFYVDDKLIGSVDIEHIFTFSKVLESVLNLITAEAI